MFKLLVFLILLCPTLSIAQGISAKIDNYTSFEERPTKITAELKTLTPVEYHNHPEFGRLPKNAPCDNCSELVHMRTDSTRYFIENGSGGTKFYSQSLYGKFHYLKNDQWTSYDGSLRDLGNGIYRSDNQETPTFIDAIQKQTGFEIEGEAFIFNNHLTLTFVQNNGTELILGEANWSNKTIGEDGIIIRDAWPNIDITIGFGLDKIKTNYVIKAPIAGLNNVEFLKFSDSFILPANYELVNGDHEFFDEAGNRYGDLSIRNNLNVEVFNVHKAFGYDHSGLKENSTSFYYEHDEQTMNLFVPTSWLNNPTIVFPIIVDPLVNSTATFTGGWMSFQYNGQWCGGAGFCGYNLIVPRPANSTITGTTFTAQYQSLGGYCAFACWMSEAAFKISGPCGVSPAPANTFWNCNNNSAGTCSATNVNVFPELGACLGSACSGNVTFQIRNSYCYCATGGNCGDNCQWMPNNTWSMTLIGQNLGTLGNTVTGNGSMIVSPPSCTGNVTLNPLPANGVLGYTYVWSTGATSPTLTVNAYTVFMSGGVITCQVTDACGVVRTATFTIACPLGAEYSYIMVDKIGNRSAQIQWETVEENNVESFLVERSSDGLKFDLLVQINAKGSGTNIYEYIDNDVETNETYYRLGNRTNDGEVEYSQIFLLNFNDIKSDFEIVPNPNNGSFDIVYNVQYDSEFEIEILNEYGQVVFETVRSLEKGLTIIPLNANLSPSIYIVRMKNKSNIKSQRLIIQ